jgi:hypothetical protein
MIDESERHAAYDAPNPEEFDLLYSATFLQEDELETRLEDRFITVGSGRLTLRKGALLHFCPSWLDRQRKLIRVPHIKDCVCPYCVKRAEEYAEDKDISAEEALELCWSPKTKAGVRAIYYGWSPQTINAVEEFADMVGELDMSASTINRRVDKLADRAGIDRNLYPHALRAASALFWADVGLEAAYLQAIMGWRSIEVAVAYLQASGRQLAQRIERAFALTELKRPDAIPREDLFSPADDVVEKTNNNDVTTRSASLWEWEDSERRA